MQYLEMYSIILAVRRIHMVRVYEEKLSKDVDQNDDKKDYELGKEGCFHGYSLISKLLSRRSLTSFITYIPRSERERRLEKNERRKEKNSKCADRHSFSSQSSKACLEQQWVGGSNKQPCQVSSASMLGLQGNQMVPRTSKMALAMLTTLANKAVDDLRGLGLCCGVKPI
ncbi:hypothetical protein TNCV_2004251 [Trichonephila clavipes]|nr:hypothetical protein TNCV_2004251 [Trichonephila clavipes]